MWSVCPAYSWYKLYLLAASSSSWMVPKRGSATCAFKVNETEQSGVFGVWSLFGAYSLQILRAPRLWDIYVSMDSTPSQCVCNACNIVFAWLCNLLDNTFQSNILHLYYISIMVLIIILAQNHSYLSISLRIITYIITRSVLLGTWWTYVIMYTSVRGTMCCTVWYTFALALYCSLWF